MVLPFIKYIYDTYIFLLYCTSYGLYVQWWLQTIRYTSLPTAHPQWGSSLCSGAKYNVCCSFYRYSSPCPEEFTSSFHLWRIFTTYKYSICQLFLLFHWDNSMSFSLLLSWSNEFQWLISKYCTFIPVMNALLFLNFYYESLCLWEILAFDFLCFYKGSWESISWHSMGQRALVCVHATRKGRIDSLCRSWSTTLLISTKYLQVTPGWVNGANA